MKPRAFHLRTHFLLARALSSRAETAGEKICIGGGNCLAQGGLGTPAKAPKFGDVQKLLLRAIGP
jgi:hypothetical protein